MVRDWSFGFKSKFIASVGGRLQKKEAINSWLLPLRPWHPTIPQLRVTFVILTIFWTCVNHNVHNIFNHYFYYQTNFYHNFHHIHCSFLPPPNWWNVLRIYGGPNGV